MRHALAEHADLFQHPDAGVVLKRDVGFDAMQLELIEAEGQQAQRDLRRQPASGVAIVDAEADACNAGRRARQAAVSDDLPIGAQTPDEVEQAAPLAFAAILHVALHAPGAILEFGRLHRLTAHIGWARLERLHGRRILEAQFAQEKTGRLELRQHNVLRSSAPYLCRMRDSAGSKAKEGGGCLPLIVCSCSHTSYLSMIFLPKTGSHFRDHALAMEARHQTWRHLAGSNRLARSKRPTQLRHLAAVWRLADHAGWACGRGEPLAVGRRANHAARAFLDHRPLAVRPQPDAAARALLDDEAPAVRPLPDAAFRAVPGRIDPDAVRRLATHAGRAGADHRTAKPTVPARTRRAAVAVAENLAIAAGRGRRRERQAVVADPLQAHRACRRLNDRHWRRADAERDVRRCRREVVGRVGVLIAARWRVVDLDAVGHFAAHLQGLLLREIDAHDQEDALVDAERHRIARAAVGRAGAGAAPAAEDRGRARRHGVGDVDLVVVGAGSRIPDPHVIAAPDPVAEREAAERALGDLEVGFFLLAQMRNQRGGGVLIVSRIGVLAARRGRIQDLGLVPYPADEALGDRIGHVNAHRDGHLLPRIEQHRRKRCAGIARRSARTPIECWTREDRAHAGPCLDRVTNLDGVVVDTGAGIGDRDQEAAAVLVLADRPARHGLLLELQVGRRADRGRHPVARRHTVRRHDAERRIAGEKLGKTRRAFAWLPDFDIAHMASLLRAGGLLVVIEEIARERRLVLWPRQRHVVALQAVDVERALIDQLAGMRLVVAQGVAGRPDHAIARTTPHPAGRVVAITQGDAASRVAVVAGEADGIFLRLPSALRIALIAQNRGL